MKNNSIATILFNSSALSLPLSPEEMGRLLLAEARKDSPDSQKAVGLIHSGADTEMKDKRGFTALMWAITKGHDEIADAIIATLKISTDGDAG